MAKANSELIVEMNEMKTKICNELSAGTDEAVNQQIRRNAADD